MAFWTEKVANSSESKVSSAKLGTSESGSVKEFGTSKSQSVNAMFKQELASPFQKGTTISGDVSFDRPIKVEGRFSGNFFSASSVLVAKDGELDGVLEANTFEITGKVTGEIYARKKVVLRKGANVSATVKTPVMEVEKGAVFIGDCQVGNV